MDSPAKRGAFAFPGVITRAPSQSPNLHDTTAYQPARSDAGAPKTASKASATHTTGDASCTRYSAYKTPTTSAMAKRKRLSVCAVPGCPTLTHDDRCAEHRRAAEHQRGSAAERGYSGSTWASARRAVLRRDRMCVVCGMARSKVADHWPTSRRELIAQGVSDPDALHRLRGLCPPCHSRETAREQPGGWNRRD